MVEHSERHRQGLPLAVVARRVRFPELRVNNLLVESLSSRNLSKALSFNAHILMRYEDLPWGIRARLGR